VYYRRNRRARNEVMEVLANLFRHPLEARLRSELEATFRAFGMPNREASATSKGIVADAKREATSMGLGRWLYLEGSGDALLDHWEQIGDRGRLETLAQHGVTEKDFREWHNLPALERKVLLNTDQVMAISLFLTLRDQYGDDKDRIDRAFRNAAIAFAWDITALPEVRRDSPLPAELKLRINRYRDRRLLVDSAAFREEVEAAGGLNQFVWDKIASGELHAETRA
jgi:hypothetical protein